MGNIIWESQHHKDLTRLLAFNEEQGFPDMIESIDCRHWEWKNCLTAWKGHYHGRFGVATLILEIVDDCDRHAFLGYHVHIIISTCYTNNLFERRGTTYGNKYGMAYYLTDNIYPKWHTFILTSTFSTSTEPPTPKAVIGSSITQI